MLLATTPIIEGKRITTYYGIVSGETIIGANVFRDFFASIRDIVGMLCKSIAKNRMCHSLAPSGQPGMMHNTSCTEDFACFRGAPHSA